MTVSAKIPVGGATLGAEATIPPVMTYGSGNSNSASDMKSFFEEESGYTVTAHAECTQYKMVGVMPMLNP